MIPSMRAEPKRNEDGLYLLPDPETGRERSWTRATTLAHKLDTDTYHLDRWKDRMLLEGLKRHPDRLTDVRPAPRTRADKDAQADLARELRRAAGAEEGSDLGTALHSLTEWYDAGRLSEIEVPEVFQADLDAYVSTMAAEGITTEPGWIERVVINKTTQTAGTFDRFLRLPDGRLVIGDLKTQKTVNFGWLSIAIQLAEYANADAMEDPPLSGQLAPLPDELDKTTGIVMHLPVGKASCSIWAIDLVAGWEAAQLAVEVDAMSRRSKALGRPYRNPSSLDTRTRVAQISYLISLAQHPKALEGLWRSANADGLWTQEHTNQARARRAEL